MKYVIPILVAALLAYALIRRVNPYEAFIRGAADAVPTLLRVLPALAAMLGAITLLRGCGALDALGKSAYGLTLDIDTSKYATGVSYNKASGEDKHLAVDFDDDTTLFTGVVTGIPVQYNSDIIVARTYIKYSDGTISYGTPVAASVASAKAGNFETI